MLDMTFETTWKPLEAVMTRRGNVNECGNYMYMGTKAGKYHLYKNINTRRYLTINNVGWFFIGTTQVTERQAFDYVLS